MKLDKRINKINASWGRLFSIIAHDLRGPFNIMLGYTDVLLNDFDRLTKQDIKKHLITIQKSALKNYQLTQNILSWAVLQRGGIKLNKQELSIREIINESVAIHLEMAKQKEIQIINFSRDDLKTNIDKGITTFVLSSIINNALKFTPKKGNVIISSRKVNSGVLIKIDDSGMGIPEDVSKNLYKLDKINTKEGTENEPGTGLGLILCDELVRIHKGVLRIKSTVGKGTTVLVLLR